MWLNIPGEVLDITLGEGYDSSWTLRSELERIGESLITVDYEYIAEDKRIRRFLGYTKTFVLVLIDTLFGDQVLCAFPRNPNPTK